MQITTIGYDDVWSLANSSSGDSIHGFGRIYTWFLYPSIALAEYGSYLPDANNEFVSWNSASRTLLFTKDSYVYPGSVNPDWDIDFTIPIGDNWVSVTTEFDKILLGAGVYLFISNDAKVWAMADYSEGKRGANKDVITAFNPVSCPFSAKYGILVIAGEVGVLDSFISHISAQYDMRYQNKIR
jgi:hypothetical protein